ESPAYSSVTGFANAMGGGGDSSNGYTQMGKGYAAGATFNAATKVASANDTIDVGAGHGFHTGDAVVYHKDGNAIGGLIDGDTYYVIASNSDASHIKLAASAAQAQAGKAINLTAPGSSGANQKLTPVAGNTTRGANAEIASSAPSGKVNAAA